MSLLIRVFLSLCSIAILSFLILFTFGFSSNGEDNNQLSYEYIQTGKYIIGKDENENFVFQTPGENIDATTLQVHNLGIGNNVYYSGNDIEILDNNELSLSKGLYYFDIHSLDFQYDIIIDGAKIIPQGPGAFIINTSHQIQKSILSISTKISLELMQNAQKKVATTVDLFPNMYIMYNPVLNNQIVNADLLRIQNVQNLHMLEFIYDYETAQLHSDIQKYIFYENIADYEFIPTINHIRSALSNKAKEGMETLKQTKVSYFPGEYYISKYYEYFENTEKKKVYYKNQILKYLTAYHEDNLKNIQSSDIISVMKKLQEIDQNEYNKMLDLIYSYYEDILNSNISSPDFLIHYTNFIYQLHNKTLDITYISLLHLHEIYESFHKGNLENFHKNMNTFIQKYEAEMNMSVYDEQHTIHNYFLFFIKNILISDFSKARDHNHIVTLFEKYLSISSVFIDKGNDITKKTALFDNAELLKVFKDIMNLNFFEAQRDEKKLLVPLSPPGITQENYLLLENNLFQLLDFYNQYKYFIENSSNRKDRILSLAYKSYSKDLNEYFDAINDYTSYQLNYDTGIQEPIFVQETSSSLSLDDAKKYLEKFVGISSHNTTINIRDYSYCTQPYIELEAEITQIENGYCFEIKNLNIEGYIFSFILIPSEQNTITHLKYIDAQGIEQKQSTNYVMDTIERDMNLRYATAQTAQKEQFNFSKFFLNTFIYEKTNSVQQQLPEENQNKYIPPVVTNESIAIKKLKLALLSGNGQLAQIRNILPITYNYLMIERVDDEYQVQIFPSNFQISITENQTSNLFTGKFSADYQYTDNHTFINSSIVIKNSNVFDREVFLIDETPIQISGTFAVEDTGKILTQALYYFNRYQNIYKNLKEFFPENKIEIIHDIESNTTKFIASEKYSLILFDTGSINIYENENEIFIGRFSQLPLFLNTIGKN